MYVQRDAESKIVSYAKNAMPIDSDSVTEQNPDGNPEAGWELLEDKAELEAFLSK